MVLILSSLVTLVTTTIQLIIDYRHEMNRVVARFDLIAATQKESVVRALWDLNETSLKSQTDGILKFPGIVSVEIRNGTRVLHRNATEHSGNVIERVYSLSYQENDQLTRLGSMTVKASLDQVVNRVLENLLLILATHFLRTLIVSTLFLLATRHLLTRHLMRITEFLQSMKLTGTDGELRLDRKKTAANDVNDELDTMVIAINKMQSELRQSFINLNAFKNELEKNIQDRTDVILKQREKLVHTAKMSSLGEMAGGMAHEINTPLTVITMQTEILVDAVKEGELKQEVLLNGLNRIGQTTQRIVHIIQSLRSFAMNTDFDPFVPTKINILIENLLSLCQQKFIAAKIAIQVSPVPEIAIDCKANQLTEVLLNLLNNSFEAVSKLQDRWVRIDVHDFSERVHITVTDSGGGIEPKTASRIMDPFFTTKDVGEGKGLGLSVALGIVTEHLGTLTYNPDCRNTQFVIDLPKVHRIPAKSAA